MPLSIRQSPEIIRSGIIPRITYGEAELYGFGIDIDSSIITDFGGHRESTDRDIIHTAIREFTEETHGCFPPMKREQVENGINLVGTDSIEYVVNIESDQPPSYWNKRFQRLSKTDVNEREIADILWVTKEQLQVMMDTREYDVDGFIPHAMYGKVFRALMGSMEKI